MSGGFLKHTTNGGKTWDFWYTPRIAWSQVAAIGAQSVSLLGERLPKPQALHPHAPLIWLHTTNGGGVWTRWMLTNPPLGHSIRTTAIFPRTGFQALGVSQDGYLWWTRTGTRWHTLWPSSDQVLTVAPIPGSGEAVAVKTSAHTTWIGTVAIPSRGPIVSGAWHRAPALIQGMDWLNRQDGWMWSSTRIWRTTNGGATWTALGVWSHQHLPPLEYRLLDYFCAHPEQLITFPTLISVGWNHPNQPGRTAADVYRYIPRLRQVIERNPGHPQVLKTERGLGYVLLTPETRNW